MDTKELQERARKALDDVQTDLDAFDDIEVCIGETEDAFGLAYPDGTTAESGYQPQASRAALSALSRQLHDYAKLLLARSDAVHDFAKELYATNENDIPTEPNISLADIAPDNEPAN